jgi:hypothetical protein
MKSLIATMVLRNMRTLIIGYQTRPAAKLAEQLMFQTGETTPLLGLNCLEETTWMKTFAGLLPSL